ncbi:hypothetical protein [Nocardia veterana]|uniref:Uncharacterized protein n=1 Tax=Nocardia veterana TaxID=132249 RepID=A0A7X6LX49_9NOCA|nr:hypothetical protein [Nocardia veterana]NKY86117.1 hypothetical protein [Nocardia veterana]
MSEQPNLFSHSPVPVETPTPAGGVAHRPLFRSAGNSAGSDGAETPADDGTR